MTRKKKQKKGADVVAETPEPVLAETVEAPAVLPVPTPPQEEPAEAAGENEPPDGQAAPQGEAAPHDESAGAAPDERNADSARPEPRATRKKKQKKGAEAGAETPEPVLAETIEAPALFPVPPPSASAEDAHEAPEGEATPHDESAGAAPDEASANDFPEDIEATVNLAGDVYSLPGRDDLDAPTMTALPDGFDLGLAHASRKHLRGLLEALIFASDRPIKPGELAKAASAPLRDVRDLLEVLRKDYAGRGVQLDEVAGGWIFRTSPVFAPFVRDLTKQKPVKLSRAQIETLAILAYRQPITRPEIDEIRGVDSGPVLKVLLERDLVRILGKKDEPGRPILYGTTNEFLEFFGLKSVKDLPTLREFTELNEDSRRVVERELGETLENVQAAIETEAHAAEAQVDGLPPVSEELPHGGEHTAYGEVRDTLPPDDEHPATEPPHTDDATEAHATKDAASEDAASEDAASEDAASPAEPGEGAEPEEGELAEGDSDEDFDDDDEDDDDEDFDDDEDDEDDEDDDAEEDEVTE